MPATATETRPRLVDAARELFHAQGYRATSLSRILDRAEVNSGSLYYFFKTKEDLLLAVLDRYVERLQAEVMQPAFDRTDDPIERIFAVLDVYRGMLEQTGCGTGCPIGNLALEMTEARPEILDKVRLNFDNWCHEIERCFDAAADRLPPDIDRARLARFVLTVMEGGILQARGPVLARSQT